MSLLRNSLAEASAGTKVGVIAGAALVIAGASWGACALAERRALARAEGQLQKGFGALAADTMERYRASLVRKDKGCTALLAAYYQSRRADRLEWAAQACLDAGKEIPEAYIGLAAARELIGRDGDALNILGAAAPKFDKIPDVFYNMAQIFRRNKREAEAAFALLKAAERAPQNHQLQLETLELLSAQKRWVDARPVAERLKSVPTDNPEVRLFVARAFANLGDRAGAQALVAEAQPLLDKKPETKAALEKAYADVLGGGAPPPAGESAGKAPASGAAPKTN